jgi:hypothetical protein
MIGALQVWRTYLHDPPRAIQRYRHALSLGATRPLPELYAAAGAKFAFDTATLQDVVHLVMGKIEELEREVRTATCVWKLLPRRSCLFRAPFTALGISLRLEHRQRDRTFRARRVVRVVRAPLPAFSPRGG